MQILLFISGLAVLLYAMKLMERALTGLGEEQLRIALEKFTSSPLRGIVLGALATSFLQSSTVLGLITMAFVGAGVLPFRNAVGVILGSNLGTTATGWLVTWIGFQMDLAELYVPLLGAGALLVVAGRDEGKLQQGGHFVVALGLLLFALMLMKDGVGFVIELVDVQRLQSLPLLLYFLFGLLLTMIIQSSTATTLITLSAMSAGIIDLQAASGIVIGANLGTTGTVVLVSLHGSVLKRQTAAVHVLFNLVVSFGALLTLPLLLELITRGLGIGDPMYRLMFLYSFINLAGILLFAPVLDPFRSFIERLFPAPARRALLVSLVDTQVPQASLKALEQDVRALLVASVLLNAWRLGILDARNAQRKVVLAETPQAAYAELKADENLLSDYVLELQRVTLTQEQVRRTQQLLVCIRDCLYSTKAVKDVEADLVRFHLESGVEVRSFIRRLLDSLETLYAQTLRLLEADSAVEAADFSRMRDQVRESHAASNVTIYQLIDQRGFRHDRASSALNINRELLLAAHSLINALENFLLPGAQPQTVSEWLSSR
ncbi:MAG: Na/Pi cotransporter family protein [Pseudohongiellaceae bacterium]